MLGILDWFFWSLGLECCLVWCPLGPDPCMPRCWLSLFSLSLSLSCVRIAVGVVFFFLSFSGAGETQTPFGVWDSPCVSSSWPRTTCSTRTSSPSPSPRSPRLVFFFLFSTLAWVVLWVLFSLPGLAVWWSFAACIVVMYNAHSLS